MFDLLLGDSADILRGLASESVDSVITDPPYGISFLGSKWDLDVPDASIWAECLRVLKPGGLLLSFASARTYHRIAYDLESVGFFIKDQLMWVYGQGMPHGNNLKPSHEPIAIAVKPPTKQSFLNIEDCRIECPAGDKPTFPVGEYSTDTAVGSIRSKVRTADKNPTSRHPANVMFSEDASKLLPPGKDRFFFVPKVRGKERGGNKHPTVKPVELMTYLVALASQPGDLVLDPFMGSGSTGVSALTLGRRFTGIELDQGYLSTAKDRIEAVQLTLPMENG